MNKKTLISPEELEQICAGKSHVYVNPNYVSIYHGASIESRTPVWDKGPISLSLYTHLEPETFISEFGITDSSDLDTIAAKNLWQVYQKGKGHIWATLFFEGPELSFQALDGTTIIEGYQLRYRDELAETWDSAEPFTDYIRENIRKIYIAAEQSAEVRH